MKPIMFGQSCAGIPVPWYAKAVAAVVVALRLQPHRPDPGLTDCRLRAEAAVSRGKPVSRARPALPACAQLASPLQIAWPPIIASIPGRAKAVPGRAHHSLREQDAIRYAPSELERRTDVPFTKISQEIEP